MLSGIKYEWGETYRGFVSFSESSNGSGKRQSIYQPMSSHIYQNCHQDEYISTIPFSRKIILGATITKSLQIIARVFSDIYFCRTAEFEIIHRKVKIEALWRCLNQILPHKSKLWGCFQPYLMRKKSWVVHMVFIDRYDYHQGDDDESCQIQYPTPGPIWSATVDIMAGPPNI